MIKHLFQQFAGYNRWANAHVYAAAAELSDEDYRRPVGLFFGSLHATLNHVLVADRVWLRRLTGEGEHPTRLDAILHDRLADLTAARTAEDARIVRLVEGYDEADLGTPFAYTTLRGDPHEQVLAETLQHVFNHQTHHRGQAHAALSILTGREPPSLDMLQFQRGAPAPGLVV